MKKNILLIGGSHGIGKSIIETLDSDYTIYVASRTEEDLPENVTHIKYDVTQDTLDTEMLPDVLDGFVYCPGSINLKPFKMLSEDLIFGYPAVKKIPKAFLFFLFSNSNLFLILSIIQNSFSNIGNTLGKSLSPLPHIFMTKISFFLFLASSPVTCKACEGSRAGIIPSS